MQANKQIDLGTFTMYDSTPIFIKDNSIEDTITDRLVANIHHIFETAVNAKKLEISALQILPQQQQIHDFDRPQLYFKLPEPSILFPRSKRLPDKKILTKWGKFAKDKGITARKKTGLKFEKSTGKMMGRWGSKSKNSIEPAIMQQKHYGRNPYDDQKTKKTLKRQTQKLKQIKNQKFREDHR